MASGAMVAGTTLKAGGALYQGEQESAALDKQADLQRENARIAREKGDYDANRQEIIAGHKIGAATAGFGASGVSSQSGSVMDVLRMSAANAERDRLNIIHGANVRAVNFENQAILDEHGAKSALQAGYFNALTSVLTGAGQAYGHGSGGGKKQKIDEEGGVEDMGGGEGMEAGGAESAATLA